MGEKMIRQIMAATLALGAIMGVMAGTARADQAYWYVVLGSFAHEPNGEEAAAALREKVADCGISAGTDNTLFMQGFAPGYDVTVVGPFQTKASANRQLAFARDCVPGAYIKRAIPTGD